MKKLIRAGLSLFFCHSIALTSAACTLPTADGSDQKVSNRNLAGYYSGLRNKKIIIVEYKSRKEIGVFLGGLNIAYSAFGGDIPLVDLKEGIPMRVWYKNCKKTGRDGNSEICGDILQQHGRQAAK